jgi:hypothetical protein
VSGADSTRKMAVLPSAMAVGLSDAIADVCAAQLEPIPVMRVGHTLAASERMVVTRPQIVIVMAGCDQIDMLRERAGDVGAELAELKAEMNEPEIVAAVATAKSRAEQRR